MEIFLICAIAILAIVLIAFLTFYTPKPKRRQKPRYDTRGFGKDHIHKNGTKYDDYGFDYKGYDAQGFDAQGYNIYGKNVKGQYNRLYDTEVGVKDGFSSPKLHPITLSKHARERISERMSIIDCDKMDELVKSAYKYGKSKRQLKKSSALMLGDIEQRHENGVALIYHNYIYIFSNDNVLKTVYKNNKIPL